jgi:hypothetical protein
MGLSGDLTRFLAALRTSNPGGGFCKKAAARAAVRSGSQANSELEWPPVVAMAMATPRIC